MTRVKKWCRVFVKASAIAIFILNVGKAPESRPHRWLAVIAGAYLWGLNNDVGQVINKKG